MLSHLAKLARSKEHLIDLEDAIERFSDSHPYAVSQRVEGKQKKRRWRIEFTAFPTDTDIPVIAADVINNLRFCLDHLMCALVPPKERGKVMFPIFFDGVWDAIVPGENQERIKQRMRWASVVKTLPDEAIAVLKELQPPELAPDDPRASLLALINGWSNRDRHERLPIVVTGLGDIEAQVTREDGSVESATIAIRDGDAFPDGTDLYMIPEYAVDVQVAGVALVAIRGRDDGTYFKLPTHLSKVATLIDEAIVPSLAPFVRPDTT